jgi:hypothetical protein
MAVRRQNENHAMMYNSRLVIRFELSATAISEAYERQYRCRFTLHVHRDIAIGH